MGNDLRRRLLTGITGIGLVSAVAYAHCEYSLTPIQPPPCPIFGIPVTYPMGVSNAGHVVGWHWTCDLGDDVAFLWTPELGVFDIPFAAGSIARRALDVNSAGRVVGSVDVPGDGMGSLAFVYDSANGQLINLETLPEANWSEAVVVNESGQVAGNAQNFVTGEPPFTAFMWQDGVMMPLVLPLGPQAKATDMNDEGKIVGWMGRSNIIMSHAFIWEAGVATDLGNVPGAFASQAMAINNGGQVLVVGLVQQDQASPVLWDSYLWDQGEWINLGHLRGFDKCAGLDLNDAGQVVGYCTQSAQFNAAEAFIWQDGAISPLDDLIADPAANAAIPYAVNQQGQVAVLAGYQGDAIGLLLSPIDQPAGDVDHDCTVGLHDVVMLLDAWGSCPVIAGCPGDVDADSDVDVLDLLILLANWSF